MRGRGHARFKFKPKRLRCGAPHITLSPDPVDLHISNTPPRPDGRKGHGSLRRYFAENAVRENVRAPHRTNQIPMMNQN